MERVTVTIKDGEVVVSTDGFAGKACQDVTRQLEAALGQTTKDVATSEMAKPATTAMKAGAR